MRVALDARNSKPPKDWKPSTPGEETPRLRRSQLAALRAWAEREGHEVVFEVHDAASGGNPNRPAWCRVMAAARGHHVHAIAAVKLDRVARRFSRRNLSSWPAAPLEVRPR
jgi:DNA invertase Pin-like site-specific DNA recombinase